MLLGFGEIRRRGVREGRVRGGGSVWGVGAVVGRDEGSSTRGLVGVSLQGY